MPEQFEDHPEELLPGSDRPRPLPAALRTRLERSLLSLPGGEEPAGEPAPGPSAPSLPPLPAGAAAPAPRPLSPEVRDRLEHSLRRRRPARPPGRWKRVVPGAGVAAAIAVLAAIVVPQLVNSPAKPGGTVAVKAAGPPVARLGLSLPSTAVNGRPAGKGGGVTGGVPGRSGPARFAPGRGRAAPLAPGRAAPGRTAPGRTAPGPSAPRRAAAVTRPAVTGPNVTGGPAVVPGPAVTGPKVTGRSAAVPGPVAGVVGPPVVTGVSPARGPSGGGNWAVVEGRGFAGVSAVDFGASTAVSFVVESPLRLKVKVPAHAPGTVDVVVVGATGRSSTSALDRYRFGP